MKSELPYPAEYIKRPTVKWIKSVESKEGKIDASFSDPNRGSQLQENYVRVWPEINHNQRGSFQDVLIYEVPLNSRDDSIYLATSLFLRLGASGL